MNYIPKVGQFTGGIFYGAPGGGRLAPYVSQMLNNFASVTCFLSSFRSAVASHSLKKTAPESQKLVHRTNFFPPSNSKALRLIAMLSRFGHLFSKFVS